MPPGAQADTTVAEGEYFDKHDIIFYLEDATTQLLRTARRDTTRQSAIEFISDYFSDVVNRRHVAFREFAYINGTPHNRRSFLRVCWTLLVPLAGHTDMLSVADYFTTINLVCEDFPIAIVRRAAKLVVVEDALDCLLRFADFFPAFQLQFYGQEFIKLCYAVFGECTKEHSGGVPSEAFIHRMAKARYRKRDENFLRPTMDALRTALTSHIKLQNVDELLLRLSQSEIIHEAIGGIPLKKVKAAAASMQQRASTASLSAAE